MSVTVLAGAPAAHAVVAPVGAVDPATNVPTFYADASGLRLQPCLAGALCPAGAVPGDFTPPDGEAFYFDAESTLDTPHGGAFARLALEAAYVNPVNPDVFSRYRFRIGVAGPGTYTVTHPYGQKTYTVTAAGPVGRDIDDTVDIGTAATEQTPANFVDATGPGSIEPFLVAAPPFVSPAGFIGDGVERPVVGSPTGNNFFRVQGPGINPAGTGCPGVAGAGTDCIQTDNFAIFGQLADNLSVSPRPLSFVDQALNTTSAVQTVTVTNVGGARANLGTVSLTGTNPTEFILSSNTCTGAALAAGSNCTVGVSFRPSANGARSAVINFPQSGGNPPVTTSVSGNGFTPAPIVSLSATALNFGASTVGQAATGQTVTVTNTGNAPLTISSASVPASDFAVVSETCTSGAVAPAGTCSVNLRFTPSATGGRAAVLSIVSDAAGSPHSVTLTGTGTAPATTPAAPASAVSGYRLLAADGGVFNFGGSSFLGSMGGTRLNAPIVTAAATPSGNGYWLFARDGGVFTFGDAAFLGSLGNIRLNAPIVAAASTPSGKGYWLAASDGGVFNFGDAVFQGSMGATRLNAAIVGMASTPSGKGYWLVGRDGGIFTFGDATFQGSTGGVRLNAPIAGMAASRLGAGYWLVATDGGVFNFGDAAFLGSTGGRRLNAPIMGMVTTASGNGYYLAARDGGIFNFGDAAFQGSMGGSRLNAPIVAIAR